MKRHSSLAALLLLSAVAHAADAREPGQLETAASVCSMADACLPRILTALRHASTEADGSPLKRPPEALIPAFTRCGAIPLLESTSDGAMFVDESGDGGNGLPYSYSGTCSRRQPLSLPSFLLSSSSYISPQLTSNGLPACS